MVTKDGQTDAQLGYNQPVHAIAETVDSVVETVDSVAAPLVKQSNLGKFELYESDNGEWHFRLKARNGEIIAVSEGYSSKNGALNGIESVRKNAQTKKIIEV